ncbi:hypothetical protein HID58_026111 [Brassica napus]|uniref:Uncharacterized protein n=2 Tax=Brassica TaxID=3705 RepID=A0A3P6BQF7_BRACM|nr:hypothetical protein HID58_026111 [Brassica napus]CAF2164332.1 unnamed protein product [Brassica napus]CAG7902347.1 unnamed protein product [Brassica rapa]VDC98431.1 unnamed protein product [Brassica rapa]
MNSTEEQERNEKEIEDLAIILFWIERPFLVILLLYSSFVSVLIGLLLLVTTLLAIIFFLLCPRLSFAGPSGIGGLWLFLSDRFMFLLALSSHETILVWLLTVFISLVNHSAYIIEYIVRSYKSHHTISLPLQSPEVRRNDDEIKELEKMGKLLGELREDGKKMDIEIELIQQTIHSDLEKHRKTLSLNLLELREELGDDGEKMGAYMELIKNFVNSELVTPRGDLNLNINNDIREDVSDEEDIKAWRVKLKSVAEEVHETYFVIQETAKAAKTTADRANLTYMIVDEISKEMETMSGMIKEEALEMFIKLREEVWETWLDFEARKTEAEVAADRAAEELSYAMVELMDAVNIRPWEGFDVFVTRFHLLCIPICLRLAPSVLSRVVPWLLVVPGFINDLYCKLEDIIKIQLLGVAYSRDVTRRWASETTRVRKFHIQRLRMVIGFWNFLADSVGVVGERS